MTITYPLRKAMIVIAVSKYAGAYNDLPGTLTSAKRIADWARQPGPGREYNVLEITDALDKPVTVQRLREEIEPFLESQIIDRLVVYFAGHGIVRGVAEQFWLLTNAADDGREGVNMVAFKNGLTRQGIGVHHPDLAQGQLCFLIDACRSTASSALDFVGDPIVTAGGNLQKLQIDMFFATMLGSEAYQPKATAARPAYCLFSDILCNALEGRVPEVIETQYHPFCPVIDNGLLADYLDAEVPKRAAKLNEIMQPDNNTRIRRNHNYYDLLTPPSVTDPTPPHGGITADVETATEALELEAMDVRSEAAVAHARTEDFEKALKNAGMILENTVGSASDYSAIVVEGSRAVAVPKGASKQMQRVDDQWVYHPVEEDHRNYPIFAEQQGEWLLVPYVDFTHVLVTSALPGDVLLHKGEQDAITPFPYWDTSLSTNAGLTDKLPPRVSDAQRFADEIRYGKARKPNNANIAGYLYDVIGDIDNARRTAHYMAQDAMLPIDLALIAGESVRWRRNDNGVWRVFADLPAVDTAIDHPRDRPQFTAASFSPKYDVPVRGILPIFRQGWLRLVQVRHIDMPPLLAELAPTLFGRAAVLVPSDAMEALKDLLGYEEITSGVGAAAEAGLESGERESEW